MDFAIYKVKKGIGNIFTPGERFRRIALPSWSAPLGSGLYAYLRTELRCQVDPPRKRAGVTPNAYARGGVARQADVTLRSQLDGR
jgi:hypothetical protein